MSESDPRIRFYAGIGARATPPEILALMSGLAQRLGEDGYVLRSGGAEGADSAFEAGARAGGHPMRIYVPWPGFNDRQSSSEVRCIDDPAATQIAAQLHPAWDRLSRGVRSMHTRNVHQVMGEAAEPRYSSFVACWTPRGAGGGGTGQALRVARHLGIPVFDLGIADVRERLGWYVAGYDVGSAEAAPDAS